jgi:hypothetical protein
VGLILKNMKKILLAFTLLYSISLFSQRHQLIVNEQLWRFDNLGKVTVDGEEYKVRAMATIQYPSVHETSLYTNANHEILIQKMPFVYYYTIVHPNKKWECIEIPRNTFYDWIVNTFILP